MERYKQESLYACERDMILCVPVERNIIQTGTRATIHVLRDINKKAAVRMNEMWYCAHK